MDPLTVALTIAGVVGAAALKLITSEIIDWSPTIAKRVVDRAAQQLPEHLCELYREMGYSHLGEYPGRLAKLGFSARYYWACYVISYDFSHLSLRRVFADRGVSTIPEITSKLEQGDSEFAESTLQKLNEFLRHRAPREVMTYEQFLEWAIKEFELDANENPDRHVRPIWNSLHEYVRRRDVKN